MAKCSDWPSYLKFTEKGIYCLHGHFYIDPTEPVEYALITHAHADHAISGHKKYLSSSLSVPILQHRLGKHIHIQGVSYGEPIHMNGVRISFHPAGHVIGSSQIRLEYKGEVIVVSGDYKLTDDGLSTPFEAIRCHTFITECTFGLPSFNWPNQYSVYEEINNWWYTNKMEGKTSIIIAYALGKAQRIVQHVNHALGPIYTHGAIENTNEVFRNQGISIKSSTRIDTSVTLSDLASALVLAPPSALNSTWMRRFKKYDIAYVSGWMSVRGIQRRRNVDRGFVLSDHADWQELNQAIRATQAEKIVATHGYTEIFAKWLREQGYDAQAHTINYDDELD